MAKKETTKYLRAAHTAAKHEQHKRWKRAAEAWDLAYRHAGIHGKNGTWAMHRKEFCEHMLRIANDNA